MATQPNAKLVKKYVEVSERHYPDGTVKPTALWWTDGNLYRIDRILYSRPAASHDVGGSGILYQIMVKGKSRKLYYEELTNAYFVEADARYADDAGD